jgi:diguanylate cyclase (GGDEF)-like protein
MTVKDLSNDSREDLGGFVRFTNEARDAGAKLCMDLEILNLCRHGRDLPQPVADYVRINKYFVENLARDAVKQQRLKQELSQLELSAGQLIAEGIESQMDLITAKLLGIGCAQGRYIARPTSLPSHVPSAASLKALNAQDNDPLERRSPQERRLGESTLIREVQPVKPDTLNAEVFVRFESNPNLELVPVVEEGIPKGLISRFDMIDNFARPFRSELYGRKPCQLFMDSDPLVVDINMSIQELTSLASHESPKHLSRGFIITHKGRYLGVATGQDLVREMTAMQVESARHCNPLTQLPGNVYIADSIDELLRSGRAFVVCYFDLDHFKPFNDVYGYSAGDRLIKTVAGVLEKACRRDEDFLGHIGGDDFIAVFVDDDWRERCDVILQQFDQEVRCFFSLDDLEHGGYVTENRIGQKEFQPLTTLSIGALPVSAESFNSHFEVARVAAEAKKKAKKIPGNSLYINQRGHGGDA